MASCLGVYAYSHGFSIRICQRVYLPGVFKDGIVFCGFFGSLYSYSPSKAIEFLRETFV